jgi:hypothetical protein
VQQKTDFEVALRDEAKQRLAMEARLDVLTTRWGEFARTASTGSGQIDVKQAGLQLGSSQAGGGPKLYVMGGYSGSTCLRTADYFGIHSSLQLLSYTLSFVVPLTNLVWMQRNRCE